MKKKSHFKINKKFAYYLNLTILFLITYNLSLNQLNANEITENNQLIIDFPKEIYEGNEFPVSVYTLFNDTPYYQIGLQIFFNNKSYNITYDEPEILIEAPQVNKDTYFKIEAIKIGYESDENFIMVINNKNGNRSKLIITFLDNDFIVEGNTYFSVLITNEKGTPINNTKIGIQSYISKNSIVYSDENGRARILAPNNRDEIIILAQKQGYINASEKIWVNINPNLIEQILQNPYLMIIISIIILAITIIIVNIRKQIIQNKIKNSNKKYLKNNNNKQKIETCPNSNKKNTTTQKNDNKIKEAKVEEIRINKKEITQKIVTLTNKKEINNTNSKDNKKNKINNNWFEGIDGIRLKIDKLTGNIESFNENNWFEGKENIRNKIDEKLKKNKKN